MGKCYRQLQREDRLRLEALLLAGTDKKKIAEILHCHISTVYREIKKGSYEHLNTDYTTEIRYSSDLAQQKYEFGLQNRGVDLKIGSDYELADYIEEKIVNENYSPDAVVGELSLPENQGKFKTTICTKTVYNYIDKGIFLCLTNKDLPVKNDSKRSYNKVKKAQKKAQAGESITHRPGEIDKREEFGHWEMDSVMGKQGESEQCLVVLTERKTRAELIFKTPDHTASSVVEVLNSLEKEWGNHFSKLFKTITVDNGTEFSDCAGMEQSCLDPNMKRTKMYYCHPYSSWERGSNENLNKMIRRWIPKGTNFDAITVEEVINIQEWMNQYPRRLFGYRSAAEMFDQELKKLLDAA